MKHLFPLLLISSLYAYPQERDRPKYHIGLSFTMAIGSYTVLKDVKGYKRFLLSALASTSIGTTKEHIDHRRGGTFDRQDLTHNAIGTGLGLLACYTWEQLKEDK